MSSYIVKPDPNKNFYLEWSNNTDCPLTGGTREELQKQDPHRYSNIRFARADKHGTSHVGHREYGWAQKHFLCTIKEQGVIAREDIKELFERIVDAKERSIPVDVNGLVMSFDEYEKL